jgi:hypothetical protein
MYTNHNNSIITIFCFIKPDSTTRSSTSHGVHKTTSQGARVRVLNLVPLFSTTFPNNLLSSRKLRAAPRVRGTVRVYGCVAIRIPTD